MAPARGRPIEEDARLDTAHYKDRHNPYSTGHKSRRADKATGSSKQQALAPPSMPPPQQETPSMNWSAESVATLHTYRTAYRLEVPPAFTTTLSNAVLTIPSIGRQSPTMVRRKERKLLAKDQLALAVRKHFNNLAVSETDVVVDFLYKVKSQDKCFRARFAPPKQR